MNVHPTKREVRLADEGSVYRAISTMVKRAMREAGEIPEVAPEVFERSPESPGQRRWGQGVYGEGPSKPLSAGESPVPYEVEGFRRRQGRTLFDLDSQISLPLLEPKPAGAAELADAGAAEGGGADAATVWQVHETYILAEIRNGMIIVDQHVAHERILYEETLRAFQSQPIPGQQLLFPLSVSLGLTQMAVLREFFPLFERLGFGVRDLGGASAVVDAIPSGLRRWDDGQLLKDIIEDLQEEGRPRSSHEERLATSYACHTAIRAGDRLSTQEMRALIDRLFATEEPFVCPHGRPIVIKMSLDEIHKRFER